MAGQENAGSIVYEVSADVAPLLQGGRQVNKVLSDIEAALDENINNFKKLDTNISTTAQAVSSATRSMGNMRGVFGQLGYQIQDVAVQLQMGQNAMMVFAQQGSQIASIFGPGGAIAGAIIAITGALAGALLPSLFNSKDATKELETAQKALGETVIKTDDGVLALSEKIQKLAEVSRDAANSQIAVAVTDAEKAISSANEAVNKQISSLGTWRDTIEAAGSQLTTLEKKGVDVASALKDVGGTYEGSIAGLNILNNATNNLSENLGITQTQALGLIKVFRDFQSTPTPQTMQAVATSLSTLSEQTGYANPKLNDLTNNVNKLSLTANDAASKSEYLKNALNNVSQAAEASKQAISGNVEQLNRLIEAAKNEAATVGFSARQRAKYVAGLLGANDADKQAIDASYDKIEAYEKEQKALKEQEQAQKKAASEAESSAKRAASAQQQVVNQLDQLADKYELAVLEQRGMGREAAVLAAQQQLGAAASQQQAQQAGELAGKLYDVAQATKAAKEEEQKRKEASQNFDAIRGQVSPVASADNAYQKQLEQLNQYATLYPQRIAEVEAVRASIEDQYRQRRIEAMWDEWSQQSAATEAASAAFTAFGNNASNALTGIITGSMTASDALRSIGNTVLNSVINTFVQMGVEWAKNAILGATTQQAAIAATTATQVGALATTTAASTASAAATTAAWTPAAIVASIGSFGGAAAVGLGAVVAALALSGKRKNGGPVSAGGMYQVGEGGMPEIYQASTGKQYMIPGDNGRVISNKEMTAGTGGGVVINIQNYTSSSVDAQAGTDANGGVTVDVIVADLNNGGPISNAITSNMNVKRTPRGQG
ncbi:phage tail length tape measure family protein [Cronobacter sakazakii]|uniref:phage tail length tape measure family protein n=2 Tax=Cronobacter sakazakii TaxID=28141 RepID=UPI0028954E1E|nr:phage tail length tape measure family protein [Cronobacter sakazakii]EIZ9234990.1 phage tail length tape measure family protein [Cronobacter sakazakii]MDT3650560.1 phage tail length tape measure family protein [Cronobacter sakazakii]